MIDWKPGITNWQIELLFINQALNVSRNETQLVRVFHRVSQAKMLTVSRERDDYCLLMIYPLYSVL